MSTDGAMILLGAQPHFRVYPALLDAEGAEIRALLPRSLS